MAGEIKAKVNQVYFWKWSIPGPFAKCRRGRKQTFIFQDRGYRWLACWDRPAH
jgi:hypothetical protein